MGLSRSRTLTLIVAIATLTSNSLSSLLFANLPDDPYHLASNFGWYLHFANVFSVFGFIGALRQHALSIAVFSNYLILDTIVCAIPRFLVLGLLRQLASGLCEPSSLYTQTYYSLAGLKPASSSSSVVSTRSSLALPDYDETFGFEARLAGFADGWSREGCARLIWLAQWTLVAGAVAATVLQFVGALCVREYAKALWVRELRADGRLVVQEEEQGEMVLVLEEGDERGWMYAD